MNNQLFLILLILAPLSLFLSFSTHQAEIHREIEFVSGTELIASLPLDKIALVEYKKGSENFKLKKEGEKFLIDSLEGYPANTQEVNDLFRKISEIIRDELITKNKEHHSRFGLSENPLSSETAQLKFYGEDGKFLTGFLVGEKHSKRDGFYIRESGKDPVYVSKEGIYLPGNSLEFVEKQLLNLPREKINWVKQNDVEVVTGPSGFELKSLPEGKRAKGKDYETVLDHLANLSFEKPVPAEKLKSDPLKSLNWDHNYVARLNNQSGYEIRTAKGADHKGYLKISGSWHGDQQLQLPKDADKATLEKIEEKINLSKKIQEDNLLWNQWVFEIPVAKVDAFAKDLGQFTEAIPPLPVASGSLPIPTPNNISSPHLSHILIAYEGAERSQLKGRTKEEAKVRATEIHAKCLAEPAKFADFAREFSDGPTGPKGGDLGEVKPGMMVPPFEKAGLALEIGGVSEVVETPFGFHVIFRTQ